MTAATNRRNRRAQARSRRRAGASWTPRAACQRRADTTFTYSDPMFLTAVDGPSGRLATYVYDSESKRRRIYEGAAFTTIVWDGWDYLQWRRPSGTHVFHTMNGEIVGESVGGTVRDYLLDPLGSVVATLDSGGIVDQFEYWPYGELVGDVPEGAPVFLWVGGLGYWFDTDERRYVRRRMLRTDLGSWMQLDALWPRLKAWSCNGVPPLRYTTTPTLETDPSGLRPATFIGSGCNNDRFPPCTDICKLDYRGDLWGCRRKFIVPRVIICLWEAYTDFQNCLLCCERNGAHFDNDPAVAACVREDAFDVEDVAEAIDRWGLGGRA